MATIDIKTKKDLTKYLRQCKTVFIAPRFGSIEMSVKIIKSEAQMLINEILDDDAPRDCEMYGDCFGTYNDSSKELWLG